MFDQLFKRPYYVNRHINAPFLEERIDYIQMHVDRGCAMQTLCDVAQYLLRIIELLNLESNSSISLEEIEQAANQWASYQSKHPQKRMPFSTNAKERFSYHAIKWLKMINKLVLPEGSSPLLLKIFERGAAIKRHANAPLLKERLLYLQYWAENGAVENSLRRIGQYLLVVMEYLDFYQLRIVTQNEIREAADRWARNESIQKRKEDCSKFAKARFLGDASRWLEMLGCLEKPIKTSLPFEEYIMQYIQYMRNEQGLSENTIKTRFFQLKDFLINIEEQQTSFIDVTPLLIDNILIKKHSIDGYCRRSVQGYATVIRSFLRYAENKNWCQKNLANSIKAPRVYKYESLPYSPDWDDVKKLLMNNNNDHPTAIRDFAILMLLSVYGMRCSEVKHLCLDDLDWENELLYLKRAKRSKPQVFPLSKPVGNAILNYLKRVRPNNCLLREVFLCRRAPYRILSSSAIYQIVSKNLKPLNLNIKHHGPHALRHACATHLINEGISLKEISDHLGHRGLETTRIYTKVDLNNLRKITEFNIGDLL